MAPTPAAECDTPFRTPIAGRQTPTAAARRASRAREEAAPQNVVLIGAHDGAGRRTLLKQWENSGKVSKSTPGGSLGFSVLKTKWGGSLFCPCGMDSPKELRNHIKDLCGKVFAIVFVVDSAGGYTAHGHTSRLIEVVLKEQAFKDCKAVVVANKQDFGGALPGRELARELGLPGLACGGRRRPEVVEASALTGFGCGRLFRAVDPSHSANREARRAASSSRSSPGSRQRRGGSQELGAQDEKAKRRRSGSMESQRARSSSRHRSRAVPGSAASGLRTPSSPAAGKWKKAVRLVGAVSSLAGRAAADPEMFVEQVIQGVTTRYGEVAEEVATKADFACSDAAWAAEEALHQMHMRLLVMTG